MSGRGLSVCPCASSVLSVSPCASGRDLTLGLPRGAAEGAAAAAAAEARESDGGRTGVVEGDAVAGRAVVVEGDGAGGSGSPEAGWPWRRWQDLTRAG